MTSPNCTWVSVPTLTDVDKHLVFKNPTKSRIAFKVKTTHPKHVTVAPSSYIIPPNESVDILLTLKESTFNSKPIPTNHKFKIVSVPIDENLDVKNSANELLEFWRNDSPEFLRKITEKRIPVHYGVHIATSSKANTASETNQNGSPLNSNIDYYCDMSGPPPRYEDIDHSPSIENEVLTKQTQESSLPANINQTLSNEIKTKTKYTQKNTPPANIDPVSKEVAPKNQKKSFCCICM